MSFFESLATAPTLKKALFDEYEGFADKRTKNLEKSNLFIVDDRQPSDFDAKGKLFSWFCELWVEVVDQNTIKLSFRGGIPSGPAVALWFTENGANTSQFEVAVEIKRGRQVSLTKLAKAFLSIVRPGSRYSVKAYKYVCPRVAESLDRLRTALDKAWR